MRDAARYLLENVGVGVELSGAAAVAALLTGRAPLAGARRPCALVCGTGTDGCYGVANETREMHQEGRKRGRGLL